MPINPRHADITFVNAGHANLEKNLYTYISPADDNSVAS